MADINIPETPVTEKAKESEVTTTDTPKEKSVNNSPYEKAINTYVSFANFNRIFLMLVIPITTIIILYLCASPVALTEVKYVNDVAYTAKELNKVDAICVAAQFIMSFFAIAIFAFSQHLYSKICNLSIDNKDEIVDQNTSIYVKLIKAKKGFTTELIKVLLFDLFMVLVIGMNHFIN